MIEPRHLVPAEHHAQLLTASLHRDAATAQRALDAWRARVDLEELDATSVRLLSLLADRLDQLEPDPALAARVGTIVRFSWLRTQALLAACRVVLADLVTGDVPFLVLKGAALVSADAKGLGRRQLDDLDLLVPPSGVPEVVGTLRARGFESRIADGLVARPRQYLTATHSTAFSCGPAEIDLHWRAAPLARRPEVEEGRWYGARLVDVAGVRVGIPSPTEVLLLALEHDAVPVPSGSGRWVADTSMLLGAGGVDPARLRARADELGLAAVVDRASLLFEQITGTPFAVAPRRRALLLDRVAPSPALASDPRVAAAGDEWQRHRAVGARGWRGTAAAVRSTWSSVGGRRMLATRPAPGVHPRPVGELEAGRGDGAEARDPWAWACRRVDLRFGVNDDGWSWLRAGWSSPEPGFTWTDAPHAVLEVPADVAPGEPLVVDLVAHGMVGGSAGPYEVHWSVDGTPVWVQRVDGSEQRWSTFDVPAGVARGGTVRIELDVRWPRTAVEAGVGTDLRRMGIGLGWLRLMSAWAPRPSDEAP